MTTPLAVMERRAGMIQISVIIPTHNRLATLLACLRALREQTLARDQYELIVVDDASSDDTAATMRAQPDVLFFRQPQNAGPAAARNVGIRAASGRYVVFLGDDILVPPPFLAQHLAAHAQCPGDHVAVLGYAPWRQDRPITPLMRYLWAGPLALRQFRYEAIQDAGNVHYGFFYTCNLSLTRKFLLHNGIFDEEFRFAYGEDTELGYRLQRRGMRLVYRQDIVADHDHPTSYRSVCRRARIAGAVDLLLIHKHPELGDVSFLHRRWGARAANWARRRLTETVLDRVLASADRRQWDHPRLAHAYDWALRHHQYWGMLDAFAAHRAEQALAAAPSSP